MSDDRRLRNPGLASTRPYRYLRGQDSGDTLMVAIGVIFTFIAVIAILNFIEFKRVD